MNLILFTGCFIFKKNPENSEFVKLQKKETYISLFSEANIYHLLGNNTKALELYNNCLEIYPESAACNYQISRIYTETGDLNRALLYALKSVEFENSNNWYVDNYADILLFNKETHLAFSTHNELLKKVKDSVWLYNVCETYDSLDLFNEELEILKSYNETLKDSTYIIKIIDLQFKTKANAFENLYYLNLLTNYYPENLNFKLNIIDFCLLNNLYDSAKVYISTLDADTKHKKEAYFYKLYLAVNEKDCKSIKNYFENAFNSDLISADKKTELINLYKNSDLLCVENDVFLKVLENLYSTNVSNKNLLKLYLLELSERNLNDKALEVCTNSNALTNTDIETMFLISEILFLNSKYSELLEYTLKCSEIYPNQPEFYLYAGISEYFLNQPSKSYNYLKTGKNLIINNKVLDLKFDEYLNKVH